MLSLRAKSVAVMQTETLLLLGALTLSVASADSLAIINANFAAVPVPCSGGYAYQSVDGGNCASYYPQQPFNSEDVGY